jgi:hypothetical protein
VSVKRLLIRVSILLMVIIWLAINYKIISTIYCNYFCEAPQKEVEEGEIDYESMSPEELQKAFEKLQQERANEN